MPTCTPPLFITGSGTDIGKTFVACRLLATLDRSLGVRCLKPIVSGFDEHDLAGSDPGRLLAAQGIPVDATNIDRISPWRFRAPVSADVAAAREGREIPFDKLVEFCRPPRSAGLTLIEGVGGVMAPLDDRRTVLDWIEALRARVILVVGSYLGSLSHALTAAAVIRERELALLAIVVSQSPQEPMPTEATVAALRRFSDSVPVLALPRNADAEMAVLARLVQEAYA